MSELRCVLVVDDDKQNRHFIKEVCLKSGVSVVLEAIGGASGIHLAKNHCPDVIFVELDLAEIDGMTVVDELRHTPSLEKIPIVVIAKRVTRERLDRLRQLQITKILVKPYPPSAMTKILADIGRQGRPAGVDRTTEHPRS